MTDRHVEHLLIGGGIAGATAAATLREHGAEGAILLIGRELDEPYHRPPASKRYLQGSQTRADALIYPSEWWAEHDIELMTRTSVMELDTQARTAKLSNKETVSFATALIATGAMVRRLNVDGSQLAGIHYLRALGNADKIREDADRAEQVVLIGGSYIGCEVAASLTQLGKRVTIVMQEQLPLERGFGPQAGEFFARLLTEHGVELVAADELERFEGEERVERVITKGGRAIDAQAVVLGVGAVPDVMLARKAGLEIGPLGGVRTNAQLETSVTGIYAAGDICEYDSLVHGRTLRVEHEDVAAAQGKTAALNMLGRGAAHTEVPYFFSDLADWASLEYVGPAASWDREVLRGDPASGKFSIWYLDDGRLVAALAVGGVDVLDHARQLIASADAPDPDALGDINSALAGA